jgi:starch-binding outer membrane protein SusE/F
MKSLYKLLALMLVALAWSCGNDDNLEPVGNWSITSATPSLPAANSAIVLDEDQPASKIRFEWSAATTTNRFVVGYTVLLLPSGTDDPANALMSITPANNGRNLYAETTADAIDYALWTKCYPAGAAVNMKWTVVSKAIEKEAVASQNISFTRFATERMPESLFITGTGTEAGTDVTKAIAMRAQLDAEGHATNVFDVYTTLTSGSTYQFRDKAAVFSKVFGGKDKALEGCGPAIAAPETGTYRITVDLNANTYDLFKVEHWSLVGDAVEGGWGGDVPLTYQGKGIWSAKLDFFKPYETAGFAFRPNGNWDYLMKRIKGTGAPKNLGGKVVLESEANARDIEFEDVPAPDAGVYTITLDLSGADYTYKLQPDTTSGGPVAAIIGETANPDGDAVGGNFVFGEYDAPDQLFLVSDGVEIAELTKDGESFASGKFLALQASKTYIINSASDGSGTTYNEIEDGTIAVARDQAYQLTVDFESGKLTWKYYNIKLFHWENTSGWEARKEILMTYIHPYTFDVTADLTGGYVSKFNSPWEVEFGTSSTALSGTMANKGPNYAGIVQNGTYKATIVVADDYSTAEYTFVKQ